MSLICPHCEKSLGPEHDAKTCGQSQKRRISRRFFFGIAFGGLAAAVAQVPWYGYAQAGGHDQINAYLFSEVIPRMTDLIFQKSPLLYKLVERKGDLIYQPLIYKPDA